MSRWQPDAPDRLRQAALELFAEQGFAATTVPQITERAGLTTRTFFRHYADKREVLFAGENEMPAMAGAMIAAAPPGADPLTLIVGALRTVAQTRFEGRRAELLRRRDIVRSDPGLGERDLRKRAAISEAVSTGFQDRGMPAMTAALLAETSVTLLYVSIQQWLDQDGDRPLTTFTDEALATLRTLLAG
ncbi:MULTISPECIES: TetR/AcrR family transcriptional regulator [Actinoplanes]|uniref:TetR/AcrR family transcriptional regulator n=1 Tax=Actinoplanes TaxID=1865 RepID=UPI0005F2C332|nr:MULTISPECIES: TetR/AcrR family transcriptional regulator [Actinoplanes]GLY06525.1 TetR family transcriptional regulator [Actinoplanes sp. NBRC 101535]